MAHRNTDRFTVSILDWDPADAGFVILSNYWLRFWRPYLGIKAATLYEQIMAYSHGDAGDDDAECYPSITSLADALAVDRRTIYGWPKKDGTGRERGLLQLLREHRLLAYERREDGWHFAIVKRPPPLTDEQVATLRHPLQEQHRRWMERNAPSLFQNTRSMVGTTPENMRSMVDTTPPMVVTTPPLFPTTPTITTTNTHQQREIAPALLQAWHAARFTAETELRDNISSTLRSLVPLDLADGLLTLRAPNDHTALRWSRSPDALAALAQMIPAEGVAAVVVVGPAGE